MLRRYEALFQRWSAYIRQYPGALALIRLINHAMTVIFYGAYPVFLVILFYLRDERLLRCVLLPAISFVLLSAVRHGINRPRPYIRLNIEPLIQKDDVGDSMPSRHVFSAGVIAMTIGLVYPVPGMILLGLCLVLALVRVMAGIHYPTDVLAGLLLGILSGSILHLM